MNRKWIACICLAFLLAVTGCSKEKEKADPEEQTDRKIVKAEAMQEAGDIYPLTGKEATGDTHHRAVAVMVNNHPDARPQSGLQKADIVYEMLAEGEITRFLAVYQSEFPDMVGPVRSARDYYIRLAKGLDSLFICHGYSPEAKALLDQGYVDHLNGLFYDGTLFKRDKTRKAPHNSYITFNHIEEGANEKHYNMASPPKPFLFMDRQETTRIEGESGNEATVEYGNRLFDVHYAYDESIGRYTRSTAGEQMKDRDSGNPVYIDNIIVLDAPHAVTDSKGRRDIDLTGGGEAYLLQKGKWNRIQWRYLDQVLTFQKDGEALKLVPGKTWVNIVPDKNGLDAVVNIM
ncbi:DUF3048 domain-containing protein [Bacillus testis]|uniref:DUF3048 domain-containing protein n=1 Tax=Bacillus testis TaxID=1622072 RepID=UPI00067F3902|nr:DUF3048 domain-containing protein [Bacillus testis]